MMGRADGPTSAGPPRFAFVGFGALASTLAAGLRQAGVDEVRVFSRPRADGVATAALRRRLAAAGAQPRPSLEETVAGADVVVAAVPAAAAREAAEACAPWLAEGCLYVDPAPLPPAAKETAAELLEAAGASYVDAAVLGTVETDGYAVPILAAGAGAHRFAELVAPLGLRVSVVDGPAGRASLLKLLRSVYMKGRDALIVEMLLAARRHGLDGEVLESIRGSGEQVPFPDLAARVLASLTLYAGRRSEELASSAELVALAGVEPLMASAGSERLRRLADLDLAALFGGERPADASEVLAAVDRLSRREGA